MYYSNATGKKRMPPSQIIDFLLGILATIALAGFSVAIRWLIRRNADLTEIKKLMAGFVTQEERNQERAEFHQLRSQVETGYIHEIKWTRGGHYAIIPTSKKFKIK